MHIHRRLIAVLGMFVAVFFGAELAVPADVTDAAVPPDEASARVPAATPQDSIIAEMWKRALRGSSADAGSATAGSEVAIRLTPPPAVVASPQQTNIQVASYSIGHYQPAVFGLRDFFQGPPGFAIYVPTYVYHTSTFKDKNGDKVDTLTIGDRTLDLDVNVDVVSITPIIAYTTKWHPFGANSKFGFSIIPAFGSTSVAGQLENVTGKGISASASNFAWGDLGVMPVRVQWDWKKASLATNYLFFAPTGRYELGAPDNVGFGFWSHEFQLAGEYRLNTKHHTSLIGAINFEINGDKEDQDYKVGNTIGLNYGIARIIPVNKGAGALDLSILGTSVWQVTDDTGSDVVNGFVHDRVHSIGGRFNYIFVKHHVTVAFNFLQEYGARARFQGSWYYASITKVFPAH
ncbi:MAG TPA: transporter [Blastocatellia bacterium]|nr:transporter [Blastocatellia bacterium]HQR36938.1 transporter [Blastocatellia bacterium]